MTKHDKKQESIRRFVFQNLFAIASALVALVNIWLASKLSPISQDLKLITGRVSAVVQSAVATGSGTAITVNLGAFSNPKNATYGSIRPGGNVAVSPGSGFIELGEARGTVTIQSQWKDLPDTSVDWTHGSVSNTYAIAVEIAHKKIGGGAFLGLI